MEMLSTGLCVGLALLVIFVSHWIYKWSNPKCKNGVLPPGSMGIPFLGETLSLLVPSHTLDLHPFLKKRIQRYGPIFRTNVGGQSLVVSADATFNNFILQQERNLVELSLLGRLSKVLAPSGEAQLDLSNFPKFLRNTILHWFGSESLKDMLLPQFEELVRRTLENWSSSKSIDVIKEVAKVSSNFGAQKLFSYDPEKSQLNISELFTGWTECPVPLNIPGTVYRKFIKNQKKVRNIIRAELNRRTMSPNFHRGDLLNYFIQEMNSEKFLTEGFIVRLLCSMIFVFNDTIPTILSLAITFLDDHPSALQELTVEHEAIVKNRVNPDSPLSWNDYKSMTFTQQVINETLRLANTSPGLFRKAIVDIQFEGYTIPAGWPILIATSAVHMNTTKFQDPLSFNPWRWKEFQSSFITKTFMPFGFGPRQCSGAEFSRVFLSTFLQHLVTKYKWKKVKDIKIVRAPIIKFPNGFHFKVSEKDI